MSNKLRYDGYDIVFQEVPNEISLVFNITGCPHKCEGCHSDYLWNYYGSLVDEDINKLIDKYRNMITCVCFMGGDQNIHNLKNLLIKIKNKYRLKTCIYSGDDNIGVFQDLLCYLDFIKIGSYKKNLGGLNNKNTNQRFYKINNNTLIDITYIFQRGDKNEDNTK